MLTLHWKPTVNKLFKRTGKTGVWKSDSRSSHPSIKSMILFFQVIFLALTCFAADPPSPKDVAHEKQNMMDTFKEDLAYNVGKY